MSTLCSLFSLPWQVFSQTLSPPTLQERGFSMLSYQLYHSSWVISLSCSQTKLKGPTLLYGNPRRLSGLHLLLWISSLEPPASPVKVRGNVRHEKAMHNFENWLHQNKLYVSFHFFKDPSGVALFQILSEVS